MIRYKPSENYSQWVQWPKHITAPVKADMVYVERTVQSYRDEELTHLGKSIVLSEGLRIVYHTTFVWYFDGTDSLTFVAILFPDGTEWWPLN